MQLCPYGSLHVTPRVPPGLGTRVERQFERDNVTTGPVRVANGLILGGSERTRY
jgi:hypothetical protein